MKYGIIADVHSNYNALRQVLKMLLEKEKVDSILCLGDIIGYGAKPNECIEAIRNTDRTVALAGNHEWALLGNAGMENYNSVARKSIEWTGRVISGANRHWLENMGKEYRKNGFFAVHASPRDPINEYVFDESIFYENADYMKEEVCFVGHTHVAEHYHFNSRQEVVRKKLYDGDRVVIEQGKAHLINCGSVGQPRGGVDNKAGGCIYDEEKREVKFFKVEYDVSKTQKEILDAGLPPFLAFRLERGI